MSRSTRDPPAKHAEAFQQLHELTVIERSDGREIFQPLGVAVENRFRVGNRAGNDGFGYAFGAFADGNARAKTFGKKAGGRDSVIAPVRILCRHLLDPELGVHSLKNLGNVDNAKVFMRHVVEHMPEISLFGEENKSAGKSCTLR